jgi:hypothetical protein
VDIKITNNSFQLNGAKFCQIFVLYCSSGFFLNICILQLSGLPPAFMFFLKVNFLIAIFKAGGFFMSSVVFLNILSNMYFYAQVLLSKSKKLYSRILNILLRNNCMDVNFVTFLRQINDNLCFYGLNLFIFTEMGFLFFFDTFTLIDSCFV